MKRNNTIIFLLLSLITAGLPLLATHADETEKPKIEYSLSPRTYIIGGITVQGAENYDDYMLIGLSGLSVGQQIDIPGDDITDAIKRYWRNGLFSDVSILADSIAADQIFLSIHLTQRPRVSEINYSGVKKGERSDLEQRIGLLKDNQLTPNMIDRAKILIKKYFDDKGFRNATVDILQRDDPADPTKTIVDINIDKKDKVRIHSITIEGNHALSTRKIKGRMFVPGVFRKTNEKGRPGSWFRTKKYIEERYKTDKENLIRKYNELGYRDAVILTDSVTPHNEKTVNIYLKVEEGQQYFLRHVEWVGNTIYSTDQLNYLLRMHRGDVYNQTKLEERTSTDEDAVGNLYYNNGYVFYRLDIVEVNIDGDSIDLELRITEGPQATIRHIGITGNDRVYESIVRRELRTKPGDLFSKESLERSYREIASMGHFDPEQINPDIQPSVADGTVDINWGLSSKSNDQIEFSLGYGQTGVIGKIGLTFANFSLHNLFARDGLRRGVMPQGNGETFSISGQTNGRYYQSYSISYLNPWFGGKRPNSLTFSAFYAKQTDVSDNYYNSAYYNSYYNYLYGYGTSSSSYYSNYLDPDSYIKWFGLSLGWGKRLRWPDDYFQASAELSYTRYMLKNWDYFLITNGSCNNIALTLALSRNSTDNQIYPRRGSEFYLSVSATPPYSLFDDKDYANLATNYYSSTYDDECEIKYKWIEYHKWKFKLRTYTSLSKKVKCPVLMTRIEFGLLGSYNHNKKSPFETFYVGGDGMSGYSTTYATETIGLRGYDNGALTPSGYSGYAYDRFTLELRYPLMLQGSTNIYALTFVEGGNAWTSVRSFNPFDMKRSAGVGVRIFLPMVGLLGIDWAYGFDDVFGSSSYSGSQFHFILGQEF